MAKNYCSKITPFFTSFPLESIWYFWRDNTCSKCTEWANAEFKRSGESRQGRNAEIKGRILDAIKKLTNCSIGKNCKWCQKWAKNLRVARKLPQFSVTEKQNKLKEEITVEFMGQFNEARKKRVSLVAWDQFFGWSILKFVKSTKFKAVGNIRNNYVAYNAILTKFRTEPANLAKLGAMFRK